MVESLDAYRLAKYLRSREPNIYTIDEVLSQYCEPTPLTNDCFPIFVLKPRGRTIPVFPEGWVVQHLRGTPTDLPALSLFCRTRRAGP